MWKWIFIALVMLTALGLWMIIDPRAGAVGGQVVAQAQAALSRAGVNVNGNSLFAPISHALERFGNSVSSLFSSVTIEIRMPSVKMPH